MSVGVASKGRSGSSASQVTNAVTTTNGSTFHVEIIWNSTENFSSIADSKSNTYTQTGAETTMTGAKTRRYRCENGVGGASHTVTVNLSAASNVLVLFQEVPNTAATALDQSDVRNDTTSAYTLAAGLTTTQATETLVTGLFGTSGSNPATHAETGLGSSTIQTAAEETNGASFWTGAIATATKSSMGTFNPSWTESGSSGAIVSLATYKEAVAAGGSQPRLMLLGVGA